jgi:hypothetical protein
MADKKDTTLAPPAANDAYTGMLAISLCALIGGCVLLYLDYSQYPDSKAPAIPKAPAIAQPDAAPAPDNAPPPGKGAAKEAGKDDGKDAPDEAEKK